MSPQRDWPGAVPAGTYEPPAERPAFKPADPEATDRVHAPVVAASTDTTEDPTFPAFRPAQDASAVYAPVVPARDPGSVK